MAGTITGTSTVCTVTNASTSCSFVSTPNDCLPTTTSISTREKKRKRKFKESWRYEFKWLSYDDDSDIAKCSICSRFPDLCNKASKVVNGFTSPFRLETFRFHGISRQHLKCVSVYDAETSREATPLPRLIFKNIIDEKTFDHLKTIFNAAYYIAKKNKPFSDIKDLFVLMNKCGHDVGLLQEFGNDISCKEIISHISMVIENELSRTLQNCLYVSLLFDTYINSSNNEEVILYIRYMKGKQVQESFLDVVQLQNETAKLDIIKDTLKHIGLENLLVGNSPSLIGIGTDGAESLVGKENGLVTTLSNLSGLEHLVSTCCVTYKLIPSLLSSIKSVKYLEKIDAVLKDLYKFYHNSSKRLKQLKEIAGLLCCEILGLQYLSDIRWIASKIGTLVALVDNYQNVVKHMEEISNGKEEDAAIAKDLLKELKEFRFVVTLHFLLDFLKVFNLLSLEFEKTDQPINRIHLHVVKSISKLESMKYTQGKMEGKVISSTTLNGIFEKIQLTGVESSNFKTDKRNILVSGILFLKERFSEIACTLTHAIAVLDTFVWPSEKTLIYYGEEEIKALGLYFSHLLTPVNTKEDILDSLLNEWCEFKLTGQGQSFKQLLERTISMRDRFPVLSKLLNIVAVMPVSTVSCERGFSLLNLIKNKFRNSLEISSLKELMLINLHGPNLEDFDPTKAIDHWYFSCQNN